MSKSPVAISISRASFWVSIALAAGLAVIGQIQWIRPLVRAWICGGGLLVIGGVMITARQLIRRANRFEREFWDKCVLDENDERVLAVLDSMISKSDQELEACGEESPFEIRFADEVVAQFEIKPAPAAEIRVNLHELRGLIATTYNNRDWPDEPPVVAWWREKIMPILAVKVENSEAG